MRIGLAGVAVLLQACAAAVTAPPVTLAPVPAPAPPAPAPRLVAPPAPRAWTAVSLEGLGDGIRHYRNRNGSGYPTHAPTEIVAIADNILLMQRSSGGWIENQDPTRVLDAGERARLLAEKDKPAVSFDNRNVTAQVAYLAAVLEQTGDARYREGARRGLEVILAQQEPVCGGWPHTVPAREPYHAHITIADEVTPGLLALLRPVAAAAPPFGFTADDPALRGRAAQAVARGDACLLRLQVVQRGALAGWAGQYDRQTLRPALGRSYELPALVAWESTGVLRYLMTIPDPTPALVRAVEGGVAWLRRSQLGGLRVETFAAEPVRYQFHSSSSDRRLVEDPGAPPLWARFYDLEDNSVVLANRDGKRVASYADVARERRTGYAWYGDWPARLLAEDYPAWRARIEGRATGAGSAEAVVQAHIDARIQAISARSGGSVGFAALDLTSGRSLGRYQDEAFPLQSVFKLPIAIEVLRLVDAGALALDQGVSLTAADARDGMPGTLAVPARLTVGDLLAAMIVRSDNVACDKLLALVGGPGAVDARLRALGIGGFHIYLSEREMGAGKGDNTATPAAMVALLARIGRQDLGLTPASARRLDELLLQVSTGPRRLKGALPAGTAVAHKTGTSRTTDGKTDATNDVGLIVRPDGGRVAVAVFVHASTADEATRESTIAVLARLAYDIFSAAPASSAAGSPR